ncbi:MAG: hypothetical protein IPM69_05955 [Ignavibacteria bacterium]|nr:hypothetical protein [Ignavibacteria bacterium]
MVGKCNVGVKMSLLILIAIISLYGGISIHASNDQGKMYAFEYSTSALHDPSAMMKGMKSMIVQKQKIHMSCKGRILAIQIEMKIHCIHLLSKFQLMSLLLGMMIHRLPQNYWLRLKMELRYLYSYGNYLPE